MMIKNQKMNCEIKLFPATIRLFWPRFFICNVKLPFPSVSAKKNSAKMKCEKEENY